MRRRYSGQRKFPALLPERQLSERNPIQLLVGQLTGSWPLLPAEQGPSGAGQVYRAWGPNGPW